VAPLSIHQDGEGLGVGSPSRIVQRWSTLLAPSQGENLVDRQQVLAVLRATPQRLHGLLSGVSAEDVARAPAPGEWSALDIAVHLRVDEAIFGPRILLMAVAESPLLQGIEPGVLGQRTGFLDDDLDTTLAAFTLRRAELTRLLERLDEGGWQRQGIHETSGVQTVADIAGLLAGHDTEHLAQIEAVLHTVRTQTATPTH
jgi:hypothetical protein